MWKSIVTTTHKLHIDRMYLLLICTIIDSGSGITDLKFG